MRIVQINHFSNKAAGAIMFSLHNALLEKGVQSYVVWGRGRKSTNESEFYLEDKLGVLFHALYTRLTDRAGFASVRSTKKLIQWLDEVKPDIIHLHCIHGYYLNLPLLFNYIKKNKIKVVWTQHDCWNFTGHCAYYDMAHCDKWQSGCEKCVQSNSYPKSYVDVSRKNWGDKLKLFSDLNCIIVTPCEWLGKEVKKSFIKDYPVEIIYNGIRTDIFRPKESNFREKYNLKDKFIILGVASEWTERKGLNDFLRLNDSLDHGKYAIVLIGLTKKQKKNLPDSIIAFERTDSVEQLVEIYSASDVFFNPTYEDNFPTTNLEALSCGTPVITYMTGGSPEVIDESNGIVVPKGAIDEVISYICKQDRVKECKVSLLDESKFSSEVMNNQYINLYLSLFYSNEI